MMPPPEETGPPPTAEEIATALFAESVLTQVRTAMMLLGRAAHPAIGEPVTDVARARKLIDQLELLEAKPEGLGAEETRLIREGLHELRLAYVEAAGEQPKPPAAPAEEPLIAEAPKDDAGSDEEDDEDEDRKRFVKKYD